MAWLTRGDQVLATVERDRAWPEGEVAVVRPRRMLLLPPARRPLDLAWCRPVDPSGTAASGEVLEVRRVAVAARCWPARPSWGPPVLIVAEAGAFARWALVVGDLLEVRHGDDRGAPFSGGQRP